jgi:hypothetical protein
MYSKWEHMSSFREHIRFLDGFDNGTLILPYLNESDSYQDNGIYTIRVTDQYSFTNCFISNGNIYYWKILVK